VHVRYVIVECLHVSGILGLIPIPSESGMAVKIIR
jgi:hypothetical protein